MFNIPKHLKPFVISIRKARNEIDINQDYFCSKLKCKNCEYLIVLNVNKGKTRGRGACYHCSKDKIRQQRIVYFSDTVCDNFRTRISSLDKYSGGDKIDSEFERLEDIHHKERCAFCNEPILYRDRKNNALSCKCGNIKYYAMW